MAELPEINYEVVSPEIAEILIRKASQGRQLAELRKEELGAAGIESDQPRNDAKEENGMNCEYDIFENKGRGPVWRCSVIGKEGARRKLLELAGETKNEIYAMCILTREVIGRANVPGQHPPRTGQQPPATDNRARVR